jgi:hypothetical protein
VDGTRSRTLAQLELLRTLRRVCPDPLIELSQFTPTLTAGPHFNDQLKEWNREVALGRAAPSRGGARLLLGRHASRGGPPHAADAAALDPAARGCPPLSKILTAQLAIHKQLKAADTICPFVFHRNGERIGYFRTAWKNACKAAGCPGALVHDMRRSAIRTFERAGVPRSVAMSIVGHKTESIYRRYAIVDEAMQREEAARLDAWMAAPPTAPSKATVTALRRGSRLRGRVTG